MFVLLEAWSNLRRVIPIVLLEPLTPSLPPLSLVNLSDLPFVADPASWASFSAARSGSSSKVGEACTGIDNVHKRLPVTGISTALTLHFPTLCLLFPH